MSTEHGELCERIRAYCERRQWYGPDAKQGWPLQQFENDAEGEEFIVSKDHLATRFVCPPATEEQIKETERALGFQLPPAFTAVYRRVANGGFGPGYGLIGVNGGAPTEQMVNSGPDSTLAATLRQGNWRIPEHAAIYLERHPRRYLECEDFPDGLLTICDWGCGLTSELDCWTGRVYGLGTGDVVDSNGVPSETTDCFLWLDFQATSIEDWFERWRRGDLHGPLSNLECHDEMRRQLALPPVEPPPQFEEHPDWEGYKRTAPPLEDESD